MFQFRWVTRLALAVGIVGALVAAPSLGGSRTLKGAEAMSVQKVPGTWGSSISVLNPSTNTASANITVDFYSPAGGAPAMTVQTGSPLNPAAPAPGGTAFWFVPNIVGLPQNQTYSAVVSADVQVFATVNLNTMANTTPQMGEEYNGVDASQVATQVFVPTLQRTYFGFTSNVVIQNTDSTAATVNMTITGVGSNGSVSVPVSPALSIPANSSVTVDMTDYPALGNSFNGGATINAGTNHIAAIVNDYTPLPLSGGQVNSLFSSDNAVAAGSGSSTVYVPSVSNNYYGFFTALVVQNVDTAPANVVVTYSNGTVDNMFLTTTLAVGQSHLFFTPNSGVPVGFQGSATVTSPNSKLLLATVNIQGTPGSKGGIGLSSYDAFGAGGHTVLAPGLAKHYYGYTSDLAIQNVGSVAIPANGLTITYVSSVNGATVVEHNPGSIPPGGQYNSFQGNDTLLGDSFNGGATVVSSGSPIVGIASLSGVPTADQLFTTNAFVTP